jgi:hypothetical protein
MRESGNPHLGAYRGLGVCHSSQRISPEGILARVKGLVPFPSHARRDWQLHPAHIEQGLAPAGQIASGSPVLRFPQLKSKPKRSTSMLNRMPSVRINSSSLSIRLSRVTVSNSEASAGRQPALRNVSGRTICSVCVNALRAKCGNHDVMSLTGNFRPMGS